MRNIFLSFIALMAFAPTAYAQLWVTTDDYPLRALREHREGITYFRLTISALGTVKDCTITQSSGSDDLDEAACDLMKRRARFKPSLGDDGQPKEDFWESKLAWKIPR